MPCAWARRAYPCHTLIDGANPYGLQCLINLDQLPRKGAAILSMPLKIKGGSGSPQRVPLPVSR